MSQNTESRPAEPRIAGTGRAVRRQAPFGDRQDAEGARCGFAARARGRLVRDADGRTGQGPYPAGPDDVIVLSGTDARGGAVTGEAVTGEADGTTRLGPLGAARPDAVVVAP
ncbi:hypothetical protein ACIRPX_35480 [Streptomyces sp. NPDC101225]|uniref:hypothetical protein n=1 Tax=Streptomyces sp. NPDC101225 TaxID=3366135 RepID=UPI00382EDF93